MQKSFRAAIIGAGSIGGLIDSPKSANTASHANAYAKDPLCSLVAVCEPNAQNREEFQKRWGNVHTYSDSKALLEHENIDILSIATPTKFHAQNLNEALQCKTLTHILCEKPLVSSLEELQVLRPQLQKSDKKILIHFMRRYDPSFIELASLVHSKTWGKALHFQGLFTKGLLHNGSHMLCVLSHLFGHVESLDIPHAKLASNELCGDFLVQCKDAKGTLYCIEGLEYSAFELSLWFENAKVEIKEGGSEISLYLKKPSPLYEGYFTLEFERTFENTLLHYASNSLTFLCTQEYSTCQAILNEHLDIHETIFKTMNKVRLA